MSLIGQEQGGSFGPIAFVSRRTGGGLRKECVRSSRTPLDLAALDRSDQGSLFRNTLATRSEQRTLTPQARGQQIGTVGGDGGVQVEQSRRRQR